MTQAPAESAAPVAQPPDDKPDLRTQVEEVYDHYRTARLNVKYYGRRLVKLQRRNFFLEAAIAVGTSATVGSLAIWETDYGKVVIGIIATISAVLGVLKPLLNLSKQIERVSKQWAEHSLIFNQLRRIVVDMRTYHRI